MCYQPITINTSDGYKQVPCGKCLECLRKYQSDWSNRMYEELKSAKGKAVFFTLTYDDQNVPKNYLYIENSNEYEIFRSPSDYGYDNTLTRVRGERIKVRQDPDVELKSLGLDVDVIDFNVKRPQHLNFISHIHKIYSDYLSLISSDDEVGANEVPDFSYSSFDEYDGDDWSGEIKEVIRDDYYDMAKAELKVEVNDNPIFRQRPVMMFNSVRKKDVQDWLKRGRKMLSKEDKNFSYFITSEYGPRTLRPHYHGVLFGVSAQESWCMMLDWQKHFGKMISWTDVDLSKGDMSYCAKYCSKGFYEHPLCAKDFFYPNPKYDNEGNVVRPFTEYHSKHYERCISLFGIDAPVVDPTFHLVSKGLGAGWIETNEDRMIKDFKDIDFINTVDGDDVPTLEFVYKNDKLKDQKMSDPMDMFTSPVWDFDVLFRPMKYNKNSGSKDYEECIRGLFDRFKYDRVFKGKVHSYCVPKYYREKIFNEGVRVAFANYVQQVNVELYQQKLDALRTDNPTWTDAQMVSYLEKQDREDIVRRMSNVKERMEKQYNKSTI